MSVDAIFKVVVVIGNEEIKEAFCLEKSKDNDKLLIKLSKGCPESDDTWRFIEGQVDWLSDMDSFYVGE